MAEFPFLWVHIGQQKKPSIAKPVIRTKCGLVRCVCVRVRCAVWQPGQLRGWGYSLDLGRMRAAGRSSSWSVKSAAPWCPLLNDQFTGIFVLAYIGPLARQGDSSPSKGSIITVISGRWLPFVATEASFSNKPGSDHSLLISQARLDA